MRRTAFTALVLSLGVLGSLPATAADATSVDTLSATVGASAINVSGTATFRDIAIETGTDAEGDNTMEGTDLTSSSISGATTNRLKFRLKIADPLPELSSSPVAVTLWPITVNGNNTGLNLHASRLRVGAPPNAAHLRVVTIAGGQITTVANVNGQMANGIIEWDVSLSNLGAQPGTVITSDGAITTIPGMSGVGTIGGNNFDDIYSELEYTVPSRTVAIGIAPAGTPDDEIQLATNATVNSAGTFSGAVPRPSAPGDYRILVRACYGPQSCSTSGTSVTI